MNRQKLLIDWVKKQHEGQLIRRTDEPYLNHLTAVADLADVIPLGYEIGLCHDLFENTAVKETVLLSVLAVFGYEVNEATFINNRVSELTNVFTKKNYPDLDKKTRKRNEADRLAKISSAAQTVKYADLMYNMDWMLNYDKKHAKNYLYMKRSLLLKMNDGDRILLSQVIKKTDAGMASLL